MIHQKIFEKNWGYSQEHINNMVKILKDNAMHLIDVRIADEYKDKNESTDLIIQVVGGDVAVRTRKTSFRDFTIRSKSYYGQKTELDKLREGFAKWYLYAWESKDGYDYVLVDMDVVRKCGILDIKRKEIPNIDGTKFIAINLSELADNNCIVSTNM